MKELEERKRKKRNRERMGIKRGKSYWGPQLIWQGKKKGKRRQKRKEEKKKNDTLSFEPLSESVPL